VTLADRNDWCTPEWLTMLLPHVDLDPCSNAYSTVRALRTYRLDRGEDGLRDRWAGSVFVNPPYDDILPWVRKRIDSPDVTGCAFLVNVDPSTRWWRELTIFLPVALMFHRRIQFTPPPGVKPSTNSKAQALAMDRAFLARCTDALLMMGVLWAVERRPS